MVEFKKENIPNYLTLLRIFLVPVYIVLFYSGHRIGSGILFLFTGATDVVDGYLARKNKWTSEVGKLLDPLADKMIQVAALVCLTFAGKLPIWIFVIVLTKEFLQILGAAIILNNKNIYVQSRWYGKVSTVVLYIVIFAVTFFDSLSKDDLLVNVMCIVSVAFMLFTFIMYLINYSKYKTGIKLRNKTNEQTIDQNAPAHQTIINTKNPQS